MTGSFLLFKFVCKAALNSVGFGVAGDIAGDLLPEVARSVYQWWVKDRPDDEVRSDLALVAATSDEESKQLALQVVREEAGSLTEAEQLPLVSFLSQIPAAIRATQRRPGDPSGRSIAPHLTLRCPADVLALLPTRLPQFAKGQQAPGFTDWTLAELLGMGSFGEVWKATNPHLPPVAIKVCLDPTAARFLRNEADLLGRVVSQGKHPGIVALLNTSLRSDPPCLMYEYVPGGDLGGLVLQWRDDRLADRVPHAFDLIRRLADIIAFAHRLSPPIVHRDLKPANLLLGKEVRKRTQEPDRPPRIGSPLRSGSSFVLPPSLQVADFGIGGIVAAQAVGLFGGTAARTMPTSVRGSCTPLYASPQQLRGNAPDPRDDVFALGVIWYQMLTADLSERPGADWKEELDAVPGPMLDVLGRCLAARADRRYSDAGELATALARLDSDQTGELEEGEEEENADEPEQLAGQLQRSLLRAQQTLARAVDLCDRKQDYGSAARLLEGLPEAFRDHAFLNSVRTRRDRVSELRKGIRVGVKALQFAGVRDQIVELLELTPNDDEIRGLLNLVPYEPGLEVVNSIGMKLRLVSPGRFLMGSPAAEYGRASDEGPTRTILLARGFHLGAHPVTQSQFQTIMGVNPSFFRVVPGHDTRCFPVENVSWKDAVRFCERLSALPEERKFGRAYRLPTEAEWEYACRAGTGGPFGFGSILSSVQANFDGRHGYGTVGRGDFLQRTSAVGSYEPNRWDLYDMHGNVWEWVADWYSPTGYRDGKTTNPRGPSSGTERVLRGGSWQNHARLCRSACRDRAGVEYRSLNAGFRVVLEVARPTEPDNE